MAPHHFLRTFKQAFHQTPHQYLTQVRLERAKTLLLRTDTPVTDICMEVGFESLGSFSWLFSKRFRKSPSAFRNSGKIGFSYAEPTPETLDQPVPRSE